ncbi:MAG TPA: HD domain-containing protein [Fibrobacteraceae bacterium]|nr:HD domain-containing protein [Fibrobacteraceae bacterium]
MDTRLSSDLSARLRFIYETEKLKLVYRQNQAVDGSRAENSAEHSWHTALMAMVLLPHADQPGVDLLRVMKMLIIHDIVEIDAGDTFLYDKQGNLDKEERETRAAKRIFGLLPETQCEELISLWREFDARETADAQFAAALDSLHPLMNHLASGGKGVKPHRLKTQQIIQKKRPIAEASQELWDAAQEIIAESEENGLYLK